MKLTVVGSGDAFGSGGRLQTCFHVESGRERFLIDCGVTSLIGFFRFGLDPNGVSTIFISHLHGDHFGGLLWWVLHARHVARRTAPLTVVGPKGIAARYKLAGDAFYAGALDADPGFPLEFVEFDEAHGTTVGDVRASVVPVSHPSGAPSYAVRVECHGKVFAYSGDTEWVDCVVDIAAGADLFICECFGFDDKAGYHMTWETLVEKLPKFDAKSIVLTHMGERMLARQEKLVAPRVSFAYDGLIIDV